MRRENGCSPGPGGGTRKQETKALNGRGRRGDVYGERTAVSRLKKTPGGGKGGYRPNIALI